MQLVLFLTAYRVYCFNLMHTGAMNYYIARGCGYYLWCTAINRIIGIPVKCVRHIQFDFLSVAPFLQHYIFCCSIIVTWITGFWGYSDSLRLSALHGNALSPKVIHDILYHYFVLLTLLSFVIIIYVFY